MNIHDEPLPGSNMEKAAEESTSPVPAPDIPGSHHVIRNPNPWANGNLPDPENASDAPAAEQVDSEVTDGEDG